MYPIGTDVLDKKSKLPGKVIGRLERAEKDVTLHVLLTVKSESGRKSHVRALFYEKDVEAADKPSRAPRRAKAASSEAATPVTPRRRPRA
jgi:hypothetical protein